MSQPVTHIVGAGLAGLACAVELAAAGRAVMLHEAALQAGGRCRSFHDPLLDRVIDNGNHLLLGANHHALAYLDRIGGRAALESSERVELPFHDLASGEGWVLRPGHGPGWIFDPARRVPGTRWWDYLRPLALPLHGRQARVVDVLAMDSPIGQRLWQPLTIAILNTAPAAASAALLWSVFRRTLLKGPAACRPYFAGAAGLSGAFIDPALAWLRARDVPLHVGHRLRGLTIQAGRVVALDFNDGPVGLGPQDRVVLALPAPVTAELLPGLTVPLDHGAILNAHFRLPVPVPSLPPFIGLVGGVAEWLFRRGDVLSVTVSAADRWMEQPSEALATLLWADIARLLGTPTAPCPPCRIIKERRAGFAATPANAAQRPGARVPGLDNMLLAGDWTDTGLPATIEGAVLSGQRAARLVQT
ncbi:hydroxysqualene dehydroxylase HpnE [Niveispirillum sp. SYP-B3756]|uniref:hydroxysqualene dehydroxylase HpnE n=1 Tax=Niveispirillum sp. SYP-B3756 TaxID=2662178 RepID=UPI00200059F1|nr:hydroxysqualene dehydroxylase HpnE [Niveispirillum sp. SYP-B3756]